MNKQPIHEGELLGDACFSAEDIARATGMQVGWVHERVQAEVLHVDASTGEWRFDSATLVRARRIARLETGFGADPQLAALTADLIEEVAQLRRQLTRLQSRG
jgi:chaperone modulatory protein CbpM